MSPNSETKNAAAGRGTARRVVRRCRLGRVLFVVTCLLSWLAMMAVHESGHVLHAHVSGGTVQKVVLHPFAISRTDVAPNPHPLFVAWGGPIWGCLLPLLGFAAIGGLARRRESTSFSQSANDRCGRRQKPALPVAIGGLARRRESTSFSQSANEKCSRRQKPALPVARIFRLRWEYLARFFCGFCLIANGAYLGSGGWYAVGDARDLLRHGTPAWLLVVFGVCTISAGLWLWNGLGRWFGQGDEPEPVDVRQIGWITLALVLMAAAESLLSERQ